MLAQQRDVGMREDGLYTLAQLSNNSRHALASLSKGGAMHIGLGGYAPHIEAGAAHVCTFEDGDLQPLFGGIFSGAIASWPRTDDNQITRFHFYYCSFFN